MLGLESGFGSAAVVRRLSTVVCFCQQTCDPRIRRNLQLIIDKCFISSVKQLVATSRVSIALPL